MKIHFTLSYSCVESFIYICAYTYTYNFINTKDIMKISINFKFLIDFNAREKKQIELYIEYIERNR